MSILWNLDLVISITSWLVYERKGFSKFRRM
jgi:hypothetical protein